MTLINQICVLSIPLYYSNLPPILLKTRYHLDWRQMKLSDIDYLVKWQLPYPFNFSFQAHLAELSSLLYFSMSIFNLLSFIFDLRSFLISNH